LIWLWRDAAWDVPENEVTGHRAHVRPDDRLVMSSELGFGLDDKGYSVVEILTGSDVVLAPRGKFCPCAPSSPVLPSTLCKPSSKEGKKNADG
jgi:hypothetical protein